MAERMGDTMVSMTGRRTIAAGTAVLLLGSLALGPLAGCTARQAGVNRQSKTRETTATPAHGLGFVFEAPAEAASAKPPASVDNRLTAAYTNFGFGLFSRLRSGEPTQNVFISPASIELALAMAYNGAGGETAKAMEKAMRLNGMSLSEVNEANRSLHALLENPDPKIQLDVANSLWANKDVPFEPAFISRDRKYYSADVGRLDFADPASLATINGWVSDKTHRKIPKVLDKLDPAPIMVLVNAIYFNGKWQKPFDVKKTKDETFTAADGQTKQLPMMRRFSQTYRYLDGDGFQAVALPYGKGRTSMYVFLPDEKVGLDGFAAKLDAGTWAKWMNQFGEASGELALPRFKIDYEAELTKPLEVMGMGPAFTQSADFSRMTTVPAWIDKVIHKTYLGVDEKGTEAAAVTAVTMIGGAAPLKPFKMIVNRPFFCAICDDKTGTVLFMGAVTNPEPGKAPAK